MQNKSDVMGISNKLIQTCFNSFQLSFEKNVISNLFEVSYSHFWWNTFINNFSQTYIWLPAVVISIGTYFWFANYSFFTLSGKWFMISDADYFEVCQLHIFFFYLGGKLLDKLFPVESLLSLFFCETLI